ncbi:MAG: ATP-binding protein [Chitinophagales bacterium]|nr:ATP-binding protein [Chitinophagales bacterium]
MSKLIDIGVEGDHIESLTKANGITALSELIWNSLDADSTEVHVEIRPNGLGGYQYIKVKDNGHGLTYENAQDVFSRLGGSAKKIKTQSPNGRQYHGKEGKGRSKSLALGDLVKFKSIYEDKGIFSEFTATIDRNKLSTTEVSDLKQLKKGEKQSGFTVEIENINLKNAETAIKYENRKELEEKFASYWISYPTFKIFFNGKELEFSSLIKNSDQTDCTVEKDETIHSFLIKVIEWNFENKKKTYLCNSQGIPFLDTNLGIRSSIPISVFIQADYIETLQRENTIDFYENDEILIPVFKIAKEFAREYVRKRLHQYSKEFINDLKSKGIYPYKEPAENILEESKRQVFDIVALQIHEYFPSFNEQDDKNKKLTLTLISEALENDSKNLRKILTEVVELPEEKREDLAELLDRTSLSSMIDTMTEIKNRLNFLTGLEQIIYDKKLNKNIRERKHLHKIIVNETWIYGDEYTYGVDDITLKNVLKEYLRSCLKRDDFEEVCDSDDNSELQTIPDVCLWHQYSQGKAGVENLVIELKKPIVDAGWDEKTQIESYATKVANDRRFPKNKTRWKFILVTKDIKPEIEPLLSQKNRKYGHIHEGDNFDVFILTWGDIITEAKTRHNFIKEKLNLNLEGNEEGLNYLRSKYKEYLPNEF